MTNLDAVIKQKEASLSSLLKRKGVTGVDVGYKYVKGKRTEEIAIRVMVRKKKKNIAAPERVPAKIKGIKTDVIQRTAVPLVVVKKAAAAQPDTGKYDPLTGGISIGPDREINGYVFAGTLGCVVTDNKTNEPRLLSNFHVMAVDNGWKAGDKMDQPAKADGGTASDEAGALTKAVLSNHIDGALCTAAGRNTNCSIVGIGDIKGTAAASLNAPVRKRGRTTLLTYGFIDSVNGTIKIDYGDGIGTKTLSGQVGVRPDTDHNPAFSDHGDSGSVVTDADNNVVGLLFAGSPDGYTYMNLIANVLDELDIRLCDGAPAGAGKKSKEPAREGKRREKKAAKRKTRR